MPVIVLCWYLPWHSGSGTIFLIVLWYWNQYSSTDTGTLVLVLVLLIVLWYRHQYSSTDTGTLVLVVAVWHWYQYSGTGTGTLVLILVLWYWYWHSGAFLVWRLGVADALARVSQSEGETMQ